MGVISTQRSLKEFIFLLLALGYQIKVQCHFLQCASHKPMRDRRERVVGNGQIQNIRKPSVMVNLVNLTKFRITMETHLWMHLGACFWKGLTEQEKPRMWVHAIPRAEVSGWRKEESEPPVPTALCFLTVDAV